MVFDSSELRSQNSSQLVLPSEVGGSVQLKISDNLHLNQGQKAYDILSVFVKNKTDEYPTNAVQGRFKIHNSFLVFTPYFPFEEGLPYVVKTKVADSTGYNFQEFQLGVSRAPTAAGIINIYPLAHEVPENLLRFYIYFNTPMKKGEALRHISLRDAEGKIDSQAFMEFKQELWSPDGKRLTLLFDPGRIKRGVSTNVELGPALLEGKQYELIISSAWQDVYGNKLSHDIAKSFRVVKPYRQQFKLDSLRLSVPKANTQHPLILHFDRIIDHALVQSMIRVENETNQTVSGYWKVLPDEKSAEFIAEAEWKEGDYQVIFNPYFEDVSGNNLEELLDQEAIINQRGPVAPLGIHFSI